MVERAEVGEINDCFPATRTREVALDAFLVAMGGAGGCWSFDLFDRNLHTAWIVYNFFLLSQQFEALAQYWFFVTKYTNLRL